METKYILLIVLGVLVLGGITITLLNESNENLGLFFLPAKVTQVIKDVNYFQITNILF